MLPPVGAYSRVRVPANPEALDRAYNAHAARLTQLQATIYRLTAPRRELSTPMPAYAEAKSTIDPLIARYGLGGVGQSIPPSVARQPPAQPSSHGRLASAAIPSPIPVPGLLPPVFIPGTRENNRFTESFTESARAVADAVSVGVPVSEG